MLTCSVPALTLNVPPLLNAASIVCVAAEPTFLLNTPALTKLLFVATLNIKSMKVIGEPLLEVSVITPLARLVKVTGVAPLPANCNLPDELRFTAPKLSHSLSCRFTPPVMLVVVLALVVSNPDPVIVPPDQFNAPFTVKLPKPPIRPPDSVSCASETFVSKFTAPPLTIVFWV